MKNPVREQQLHEEKIQQICREILGDARNELYLRMRFLDMALWGLRWEADPAVSFLGTDGNCLYYAPQILLERYRQGNVEITRGYFHSLLHCLFCHWFPGNGRQGEYWDLACDMAVELLMDTLPAPCLHRPASRLRREIAVRLRRSRRVLTAQRIRAELEAMDLSGEQLEALKQEFLVDDHRYWNQKDPRSPGMEQQRKNWDEIREKTQVEMETFSKEAARDCETFTEQFQAENRKRYDYREFLRKFCIRREEMQVDMDTFDYIFYNYGMQLYGNMPLIEPLETKEVNRIQDFAIVIDTSMSCKGELVQKFLEETYSVLQESQSFFRKMQIHILQCDEQVRQDRKITSQEELKEYMEHVELTGQGGTDFRPPFAYVEELRARGEFTRLRGLLYFTDGYGIFPAQKPDYETAFIFMKEDYQDVDVPPWAIKLILEPEDLSGREKNEY